jgi:protein-S-isoprenylcysteine O-methyltransferase Ste14
MSNISISALANIVVVVGLLFYGFMLFAEYFARGRWAKNVTGFLAGLGMLALAAALILTPENAEVIVRIARTTKASSVLVWVSTGLLLAAIAAFGIITYSKPLRLWHERKIERDLHRELPKIP